ncbi:TPA: hypothetical protein DEP30_02130 [Candidatus Nomurabacteria bacterium]|uniref:Uncharacterized protein n=1 Tax=Candidatus Nomurabacteria bacterium GW2011_GWE1_35_16 TaxID=1618761 RepID=A0A0G0BT05_9BACT|nr:MAG: hypothetical protein UR55_C0002G0115 [Candidatus Nomurabacteria bacterium GW2011_GWF1_34_20]KKP63694.1 MAG: hypothetical protein UR57_C0002G0115 [Candidatus Nomurabacteria bacterium GW2011_GWE2_34_25]KKP66896.1 MAG: hypothetical protein UR64_C0002G0112 [Candidatus Nomurabacteria bacterium GW2011_GWE1_35_16]KKP83522.1 MAG: hypothetical protein UR85_C0004G0116 [Candidatus Nomurabacteria bacterium GW2011_GWF2_35_66]HAE36546.1 hypothetical protein [Candidatus Nomurabacteria bacterium]
MTTEKTYNLEQLRVVSVDTGIPLRELQEEYGVFEFVFSSLEEAQKGYHKISGKYENKKEHPELIAYINEWKKLTESEYLILAEENLNQIIYFLNNCFPSNDTLVRGLELAKKNIGSDLSKMVVFIKTININRQHTRYVECPVYQYEEELYNSIDELFLGKIGNKHKLYQYEEAWNELAELDIDHHRSKFPKFKELLEKRLVSTAKTPEALLALPYKEIENTLNKWNYFSKTKSIEKILPTLDTFLSLINKEDSERYDRPNKAQRKVHQLFSKCETEDQAKRLMDIARPFYYRNEEEKKKYGDVLYDLFKNSVSRIIHKKFPHPKLANFKHIANTFQFNKYELEKMDSKWRQKSREVLQGPIVDWYRTFDQIHDDYKPALLTKWNTWGIIQFSEMTTWEELSHFDLMLLPVPGNKGMSHRYFWSPTRTTFSAFILLLNKLIEVVPKGNENTLLNLIKFMDKCLSEVHTRGLFREEQALVLKKIVTNNPSMAELESLYQSQLPEWNNDVSDYYAPTLEVVIDAILEKDFSYFDKIFERIKTSQYLKSKYLKMRVNKSMVA